MYATVDQLRAYIPQLPTEAATPGTEELLNNVLIRATSIIDAALAQALGVSSFGFAAYGTASTKLVNGYGGEYLTLPAHEAGSVTLIEYLSSVSPSVYTTLDTDYWSEEEDGRIYYPSGQMYGWFGSNRYRVTAKWGYGPVPAAIEEITLELAVNIWRSKTKGSFTEVIGVEGAGAVRVDAGLTKAQQAVIKNVAQAYWSPSV
jgi:hypothetical protein